MLVQTLFTKHDYACRTNTRGGVQSLTVDLIQHLCATCTARVQDRTCCRNIVTVERKLASFNGTPATTRKCARENCTRHILITPENQDVVTLVCEWCVARQAAELKRTICVQPGCKHQGFRNGVCQFHFHQSRHSNQSRTTFLGGVAPRSEMIGATQSQ